VWCASSDWSVADAGNPKLSTAKSAKGIREERQEKLGNSKHKGDRFDGLHW
jgi:hypothetical protein